MTRSPDSAPYAVTQQCSPTTPVSDAHSLKPLGKEHEFAMQCRRRSCKYFCTDQSSSSALVLFAVERKWNSSCLSVQAKLQNQGLLITEPQRFPRAYTHKKKGDPPPPGTSWPPGHWTYVQKSPSASRFSFTLSHNHGRCRSPAAMCMNWTAM